MGKPKPYVGGVKPAKPAERCQCEQPDGWLCSSKYPFVSCTTCKRPAGTFTTHGGVEIWDLEKKQLKVVRDE